MIRDLSRSHWAKQTPTASFFVRDAGETEAFLVASVSSASITTTKAAAEVYSQIAETLRSRGLQILQERIFGNLSSRNAVMATRADVFHAQGIPPEEPATYIQGNPLCGEGLAGVIIRAVRKARLEEYQIVTDHGVPCGRIWRRNGVRSIVLQNRDGLSEILGSTEPAPTQVRRMIEQADHILREYGASYRDVTRTWFYLRDILTWYPQFNKVRNEKYGEFGIMPGPGDNRLLLPASTGIGGDVTSGAVAVMDLLAVTGPKGAPPCVKQLSNGCQLDAFCYGSAFSRGACIREPGFASIHVSGTAAIDEQGRSLHPRNIRYQITTTLDAIEALLAQKKAGLQNFVAATIFLKRPEDASVFWEMMAHRNLHAFPAVCVVADLCREELLFEIDGEVVV